LVGSRPHTVLEDDLSRTKHHILCPTTWNGVDSYSTPLVTETPLWLGFKQFSFNRTRLALTPRDYSSFVRQGLFLACYGPLSLSGFRPVEARVSQMRMGYSQLSQ
jgi:hypothetical protein